MARILYNVTVKIQSTIVDDWKKWMTEQHIPDVMTTGCFESYRLCKLLLMEEGDEEVTFAVQYVAPSMKVMENYQLHFAKPLQQEHTQRYQGKYVAFRTLLEVQAEG